MCVCVMVCVCVYFVVDLQCMSVIHMSAAYNLSQMTLAVVKTRFVVVVFSRESLSKPATQQTIAPISGELPCGC